MRAIITSAVVIWGISSMAHGQSSIPFDVLMKDPTSKISVVELYGKTDDGSDCNLRMLIIGIEKPFNGWFSSSEKHGYACRMTTTGPVIDQNEILKDRLSIPATGDDQCFEIINRDRDFIRGPTVEGVAKFWNTNAPEDPLVSLKLMIDPFAKHLEVSLSRVDTRNFNALESTQTEVFTCHMLRAK